MRVYIRFAPLARTGFLSITLILSACATGYEDIAWDEKYCGEYMVPFAYFKPCILQRMGNYLTPDNADAMRNFILAVERIDRNVKYGTMSEQQAYAEYNGLVVSVLK